MIMSGSPQFMHCGPISPRVHGTLDYPLAVVLIAGPLVLNFGDNTAKVFILVVGVAAAVLAVATAWSRGIVHLIPPVWHGYADIAATVALIVAPFVLGYSDHAVPTVFSIVLGAGGLGATLLTRFDSDLPVAMPAEMPKPAH
jgi:hypothetical protein